MAYLVIPRKDLIQVEVSQEDILLAGFVLRIKARDYGEESEDTRDWVPDIQYQISVYIDEISISPCFHIWGERNRKLWLGLEPREYEHLKSKGVRMKRLN